MNGPTKSRGLSLVEVLVAVAICAVAVVAAVALFGPAVAATRESSDRRTALRLAEVVDAELRRSGFAVVESATAGNAVLELAAAASGSQVVPVADASVAGRYFRVEVRRALRPASDAACLVLMVRVSWPLTLPDGTTVPEAQRAEFRFHTAIDR